MTKNSWVAFVKSAELHKQLSLFAIEHNHPNLLVEKTDIRESIYKISAQTKLYIIEFSAKEDLTAYEIFIQKAHALGALVLILYNKKTSIDFNWAKNIFVDQLQTLPLLNNELEEVIFKTINSKKPNKKEHKNTRAKILTFIKLKPHSGSMTAAINSANLLAAKNKVLLIDFDNFFSPTVLHCNLEPQTHLSEMLLNSERIDTKLIKNSAYKVDKNLDLLASQDPLDKEIKITNHSIDKLISQSTKIYDIIIIHLPFGPSATKHPAVTLADNIISVVTLNSATRANLLRLYPELLKSNAKEKFKFWVNNTEKYSDIDSDEFFKATDIIPCGEISYDFDLMAEAREEHVLATKIAPDSKFAKELAKLLANMQLYDYMETSLWEKIRSLWKK